MISEQNARDDEDDGEKRKRQAEDSNYVLSVMFSYLSPKWGVFLQLITKYTNIMSKFHDFFQVISEKKSCTRTLVVLCILKYTL